MKRSEALAILSRDHHHALVVAQRLRRAGAETVEAARGQFLAYWADEGRRHFQLEEELLLPAFASHSQGAARDPLVLRVLSDHVTIRSWAAQLAATAAPTVEALHQLGSELAAHVRLEERELFPLIEAAIPAGELLALARALDQS